MPLTGRLVDFGFAGVRTWSLVVSLAALVYGGLVLRSRSRTSTQGRRWSGSASAWPCCR